MSKLINISEASSIAIHCLGMLVNSEKPLNITDMSSQTVFSKNHMAKVLQILAKHRFLGSNRGPSGGFHILKDPKNTTFLEVFELIEGKIEVPHCGIDSGHCPFTVCVHGDILTKLTNEFTEYYSNRTIHDLIDTYNEKTDNNN